MRQSKRCLLLCVCLLIGASLLMAGKKKIVRLDDLPRHTYTLPMKPSETVVSDEAFTNLRDQVGKDVLDILDQYEIEDKTTLKDLYGILSNIALLKGDAEGVLKYQELILDLQEKPADKYVSGMVTRSIAQSWQETGTTDIAANLPVFQQKLEATVNTFPWDIVQDVVEQIKGVYEIRSKNLMIGLAQSQLDPAYEKTGNLSRDMAQGLISMRVFMDHYDLYKPVVVEVLTAYIDANKVEKEDIWAERDVDLKADGHLKPVLLAIWDSGVDTGVFEKQLFTNAGEKPDGRDNDGNGFVDDIHGIAFDLKEYPSTALLFPLTEEQLAKYPSMITMMKGLEDLSSAVNSEESAALKKKMATMQPDQVRPFIEELGMMGLYSHGTHVAGIALKGNPAAKILVARISFDYKAIPEPFSVEQAKRAAANYMKTVQYFKDQGVRAANMSWGWSLKEVEGNLEANGIGRDAEERQKLTREIFDILKQGLYDALKSQPDILFVSAAGNSDSDIEFDEIIPNYNLPNLLSVGAVDQAGDETSFTSFGENVHVHANGFEVESYIPGGTQLAFSGTSMASPNVLNLVGKLLAIDPDLTVADIRKLIMDGTETSEDGRIVLINPKKSIGIVKAR
ncbi:S8 family serine peptidase [bacterium]|nr:S8 family serine peptidase [bacterium]